MPKSKTKADTDPKIAMAQHEPNMVPTWLKMSQHSPKWPKISPIWSQLLLLPNKGQHKPQNTTKMAQHEPNMVPTWPNMFQHSPKWPKISPNMVQLLPNKGQHKPQNTPTWLNMSPIWCRHSPQWPNISPSSGKHSLSAACHKRKKQKQPKNSSKNDQQRSLKIVFFPWYLWCFLQTPCMDENSTTLKCPNPRQRPTQIPK